MPQAVAERLFERCGIEYMEGYGMTETISQTHMNPPGHLRKQCLGIPTFDTESLVIDPESLRPLGPNERGEIVSRGPQLLTGYWNNPEATQAAFIDIDGRRFLRTGDLGYYDEDGYLLHRRSAEAHDQRGGIQGVAGGSRDVALHASRHSGSGDRIDAGCAARRNGQSVRRAEAAVAGTGERRADHRVGQRSPGRLQSAAHRGARRRAAAQRHGKDSVAHAAGAGMDVMRRRVYGTPPWRVCKRGRAVFRAQHQRDAGSNHDGGDTERDGEGLAGESRTQRDGNQAG